MPIERIAKKQLLKYSKQYPVITITGPRQSGKTTLCKSMFSLPYTNLEDISERDHAKEDPITFISKFKKGAIIDEIQRVPELLSQIQVAVDEKDGTGLFVLTGSQNLSLMQGVTQSLAGRTAILTLLPFSYNEAYGRNKKKTSLDKIMFTGFYPRIFDKNLDPSEALSFYLSTYIERDIRNLAAIQDLATFTRFLRLAAGRTGNILDLSSMGNDLGISHNTVKSWMNILEATYIIQRVEPYHVNFGKRIVKSPKLFFVDTGIVCNLLGIEKYQQLNSHYLRGSIFETYVFSELLKLRLNVGKSKNIYFFQDNSGYEIDFLLEHGGSIDIIEVKSSAKISESFFTNLNKTSKLIKNIKNKFLIYGGDKTYNHNDIRVVSFRDIYKELSV